MHLPRTALTLLLASLAPACTLPDKLCIGDCPEEVDPDGETVTPDETGDPEPTTTAGESSETGEPIASCDIPDDLGPFGDCADASLAPGEFCFIEGGGIDSPKDIAAAISGRFNAGGTDLLIAHGDGTVTMMLDGESPGIDFEPTVLQVDLPSPFVPTGVGDIDEDGNDDVVGRLPGETADFIEVYMIANDQLSGASAIDQGKLVFGPAIADWNLDDNLDLVVIAPNGDLDDVYILYGDGTGEFTPELSFTTKIAGRMVFMGDLGDDGRGNDWVFMSPEGDLDFLITSPGDVLLSRELGPDLVARDAKIADLGGDARGDIVVLTDDTATGTSTIHVLIQTGTPVEPDFLIQRYPVVCGATTLALGRLDGDEALDIAVVGPGDPTVMIRRNDGLGGFDGVTRTLLEPGIDQLHLVDASGDGYLDIVGTSRTNNAIRHMSSAP